MTEDEIYLTGGDNIAFRLVAIDQRSGKTVVRRPLFNVFSAPEAIEDIGTHPDAVLSLMADSIIEGVHDAAKRMTRQKGIEIAREIAKSKGWIKTNEVKP